MLSRLELVQFMKTRREGLCLFFILFIGLILRLINLGVEPYWGDEILSLSIVKHFQNIGELLQYIGLVEIHPPLYYLILHFWINWFGTGEFAVRFLSVIFSVLIIFLTYVIGRKLFANNKPALLAAFLVAVLPGQIEFGTEARPYALFVSANLIACLAYLLYKESSKIRFLFLYVLSAAVSIYLHYSGGLFLMALTIYWFFDVIANRDSKKRRTEFLHWLYVQTAIFLSFFPWLSNMLAKIALRQYSVFGISAAETTYIKLIRMGSISQQLIWLTMEPFLSHAEIFSIWLAKALIFLAIIKFAVVYGRKLISISAQTMRSLKFLIYTSFLTLTIFIFSPISTPYSDLMERHVYIVTIFLALILGYILFNTPLKLRLLVLSFFLVSLTTFLVNIVGDDGRWEIQHRIKATANFINDNYEAGDMVLIQHAFFRTDFNYYLRPELESIALFPPNYYGIDMYNTRGTLGLVENEMQFRIKLLAQGLSDIKMAKLISKYQPKRIWVAYFPGNYADSWLVMHGWYRKFYSTSNILPLALYEVTKDKIK